MKYSKAAAVVVGSVMALGATAPAFAAEGAGDMPPMSLDGALADTLSSGTLDTEPLHALQGVSKDGDPLKPVTDAAGGLSAVQDAPQTVVGAAKPIAPLLGGLQAGGGI